MDEVGRVLGERFRSVKDSPEVVTAALHPGKPLEEQTAEGRVEVIESTGQLQQKWLKRSKKGVSLSDCTLFGEYALSMRMMIKLITLFLQNGTVPSRSKE